MSLIDKNKAIIDYLMTCPVIYDNPLYFNVANEKDNNNQLIINGDDATRNKPFIDGTVEKRYTVSVLMYKSVAYNPIVLEARDNEGNILLDETGKPIMVASNNYIDENMVDMSDGQEFIDWLLEQDDNHNYPDFGENCIIERIYSLTNKPIFNGVNADKQSPLAQYSIGIRVEYIDTSKQIWN